MIARVVPVAFAKSNGPLIVVVPVNVDVPVVVSSPAIVRVLPSSNVSLAFERRKSAEVKPSSPFSRHTPFTSKQPDASDIPFANVDVAPVTNS